MPATLKAATVRKGRGLMVVVLLVLGFLTVSAVATAEPKEALSVTVADGILSLEAVDVPLDQILIKIGEAIHARVVIETVLAADLAKARVDTSFTRLPVIAALRRLLQGRQYVMMFGPAGVDEVRIYVDGTSGYRELTAPGPMKKSRPTSIPMAAGPPDDPVEVARLRQTALSGPDASGRAEALDELSSIRDTKLLADTLAQVLARERDSKVLQTVFEVAAQLQDHRIPPEALRTFVRSDRDGTPRAQAVELLTDQAGDDRATRALLQSLATNDVSAEVREAAKTALGNLEGPPPRPASEIPHARVRTNPAAPGSR